MKKSIIIEKFLNEKMLAKNNLYILSYNKGELFLRDANSKQLIQKKRIHKKHKSFVIIERALRYEPRVATAISDDTFLYTDHGAVYEYDAKYNSVRLVHQFREGMNNPLFFCTTRKNSGDIFDLLYGEYIWNTEKGPVSIYRYRCSKWKKVYSFPANTIKHIHNIIYDKYKGRYIILTGDENRECALWEANYDFSNVSIIGGGSQKYRACVAWPTINGIYFATDTPLEQNWLYFLSDDRKLTQVCEMPGPCIYGIVKNECLYMATSVEGDPELGKWRYRFSNKIGKGVSDRKVHILKMDNTGSVMELGTLRKDWMPMWLFQFGNAQFPYSSDETVYFTTQSTKEKGTYIIK